MKTKRFFLKIKGIFRVNMRHERHLEMVRFETGRNSDFDSWSDYGL